MRSLLHGLGFRFSLGRKDLPGRPDVVLPRFGTVVFVHGCFWHRHRNCANSVLPKTRPDFWAEKLNGNVVRDARNAKDLKALGWRVLTVWECETEDESALSRRLLATLAKGSDG